MKQLKFLALGTVIMLGLAGCEKTAVTSSASVDTFIRSIKNPKDTTHVLYAAIHSVFSYNLMANSSVISPDGTTFQLTDFDKNGNSFYNAPADSTYSLTLPTLGTYKYTITFKDKEVITYNNTLSSSSLQPPVIVSLFQTTAKDSVYFSFKALAGSQAYQLKITKGTTQVYYQPAFTDASTPPRTILRLGFATTLFTTYGSGVYTFEVDGMLFESTDYTYLQAIGAAKKDITL